MSDTVTSVNHHGTHNVADQEDPGRLQLRGGCDRYEVEWDAEAKVTPMGSLVFFAQYLQTGGLIDRLCAGTPLAYNSNNAPKERDVLGTIVLSILNGQTRYAHINALRGDRVGTEVLGVSKLVSEDSVRRALKRGTAEEWDAWLTVQERAVYEPLLREAYVLDIDNTVKPLYGHQEGAELGYNPKKPGRPSHNYHTYFIGSLRVVLGVEVMPGKQHSGKHSLPGLWRMIDSLPADCRPRMIRGDVSYGNEDSMIEAEKRNQSYLFKLRQTAKVKGQIRELECDAQAWCDAGEGWQGAESELKLMGWSRSRRCVFLRRPAQRTAPREALPMRTGAEFDFVEQLQSGPDYEYRVERVHPPGSTGATHGGHYLTAPSATCRRADGQHRAPQDHPADLDPRDERPDSPCAQSHRPVLEPPGSNCGAVERRGDLGHHSFGRFRQMVAGKGARSGRRGQSDIAEAHAMTYHGAFQKAVEARSARFNCSF